MATNDFDRLMMSLGFEKTEGTPVRWVRECDNCRIEVTNSESEDCGLDAILKDLDGNELCRGWGECIENALDTLHDVWNGKVDAFRDMQDDVYWVVEDFDRITGR